MLLVSSLLAFASTAAAVFIEFLSVAVLLYCRKLASAFLALLWLLLVAVVVLVGFPPKRLSRLHVPGNGPRKKTESRGHTNAHSGKNVSFRHCYLVFRGYLAPGQVVLALLCSLLALPRHL